MAEPWNRRLEFLPKPSSAKLQAQSYCGLPGQIRRAMLAANGSTHCLGFHLPPPLFFDLWGCMFIVIGLCILLSPVFALWKAGRVFYFVTERSAIIFEITWTLRIQSFDASAFGGFERVSRGERDGDILFQRTIERRGKGTHLTEIGFFGLRNCAEAERALRSMMEHNGKAA